MSKSLQHARHNNQACNYLHKAEGDGFPDWVITTAFYTAIHYVYALVFPYTDGATTYTNFDQYLRVQKSIGFKGTKHELTHDLVRKHHPSIEAAYAQLKSASHTSRYLDYQHDPAAVKRIRTCIKKVTDYSESKIVERQKKEEQKKGN